MNQGLAGLLLFCSLMSLSRADVLVVDAAGAGDFTEIQAAIDAAVDGDTILVHTGGYSNFAINRKALTVTAAVGMSVTIQGSIRVRRLLPSQTVVIEGMTSLGSGSGPASRAGAFLFDNAGPVRLEASSFTGADNNTTTNPGGGAGLYVLNCPDVVVSECSLAGGQMLGGDGWFSCYFKCESLPLAGPGLDIAGGIQSYGSELAVFDSVALGGHGQDLDGSWLDANPAGSGARLSDSKFFASGSTFVGGDGGDSFITLSFGGDGGHGISLDGVQGSSGVFLETQAIGGMHGYGVPGFISCVDGCPGQPIWTGAGSTETTLPQAAASMQLVSPATEATPLPISFSGTPGDDVFLFISTIADLGKPHPWIGELAVGLPLLRRLKMGKLDGAGQLTVALPLPAVPTGEALNLFVQALSVDASGNAVLGTPRTIVVLDSSI